MADRDEGLKRAIEQARVEGTVVDGASGRTILGLTGVRAVAHVPEDRGEDAVRIDAQVAKEGRKGTFTSEDPGKVSSAVRAGADVLTGKPDDVVKAEDRAAEKADAETEKEAKAQAAAIRKATGK